MKIDLKAAIEEHLSDLNWTDAQGQALLRRHHQSHRNPKRLSLLMAVVLSLLLLTAAAIAALSIRRAPKADAVTQARRLIAQKYGLTPATLGLFYPVETRHGDAWEVVFYGDGLPNAIIGSYSVILKDGKAAQVSWTHDSADQALVNSGSPDSPAWGQKQMLWALLHHDEALEKTRKYHGTTSQIPTPPPVALKEGEAYWSGRIIKRGNPTPGAMSREEAMRLAREAILDEFDFDSSVVKGWVFVDAEFYQRDGEGHEPMWSIQYYTVINGVETGFGVILGAETGEIFTIGITTGGNG